MVVSEPNDNSWKIKEAWEHEVKPSLGDPGHESDDDAVTSDEDYHIGVIENDESENFDELPEVEYKDARARRQ